MTRLPIPLMHSLMLGLGLLPPLPERREEVAPGDVTIHVGDEQVHVAKGEPIKDVLLRIDEARARDPMEAARRAFASDCEPRPREFLIHEAVADRLPEFPPEFQVVRDPRTSERLSPIFIKPHRDTDLLARGGPCDPRPRRADPERKARRKAQKKARRKGRS